jgi:arsenite oxidase small subunit
MSAATAVAAAPGALAQTEGAVHRYERVRLSDRQGRPLHAGALRRQESYIFDYPYVSTPCFLIRLNRPAPAGIHLQPSEGVAYDWSGGVGRDRAVVAFSAICPHQLSFPSRVRSVIDYRRDKSEAAGRANVIVCCAHHSVYDPAAGARVLDGPAPQPLTAILLEYETKTDALYATGTVGIEVYREFFSAYRKELNQVYGRGGYRKRVSGSTAVEPMGLYTRRRVHC